MREIKFRGFMKNPYSKVWSMVGNDALIMFDGEIFGGLWCSKAGDITENICTKETPCSQIQVIVLDQVEKILKKYEAPGFVFYNSDDNGVFFTDSDPAYFRIREDGDINVCVKNGDTMACEEETREFADVLQHLEATIKKMTKKHSA